MKIAVIGGAGVRTPLLVRGLSHSDLPLDEIALYDIDSERLSLVAPLARRLARGVKVRQSPSSADAVRDADFVFTSIRAGGIDRRAHDERIARGLGVVGQETVGPAGFAMALRNIPAMVEYARQVEALAPGAWIVNFTNPVGIVTQAVRSFTGARIIGICDTPVELCHDAAAALQLDPRACRFDYFGLNHLGWLREIYLDGRPRLQDIWTDDEALARVYKRRLFDIDFLKSLKLLPSEYLYYYYRPAEAAERLGTADRTRGEEIRALNDSLFAALRNGADDPVQTYFRYLAARDAGYMAVESGQTPREAFPGNPPPLSGYDRIAFDVVHAIHFSTNAQIPLNVRNDGSIPDLDPADVIEVPCTVNRLGAIPVASGPLPHEVRPIVERVKDYERLTVAAAMTPSHDNARKALAANPLVPNPQAAAALLDALQPLW